MSKIHLVGAVCGMSKFHIFASKEKKKKKKETKLEENQLYDDGEFLLHNWLWSDGHLRHLCLLCLHRLIKYPRPRMKNAMYFWGFGNNLYLPKVKSLRCLELMMRKTGPSDAKGIRYLVLTRKCYLHSRRSSGLFAHSLIPDLWSLSCVLHLPYRSVEPCLLLPACVVRSPLSLSCFTVSVLLAKLNRRLL